MRTIVAKRVVAEVQEPFLVVGFIDEEQYLILQRSHSEGEQDKAVGIDTYYVEIDDQSGSCYGGIKSFDLWHNRAKICFSAQARKHLGQDELEITFQLNSNELASLRKQLAQIFVAANCLRDLTLQDD